MKKLTKTFSAAAVALLALTPSFAVADESDPVITDNEGKVITTYSVIADDEGREIVTAPEGTGFIIGDDGQIVDVIPPSEQLSTRSVTITRPCKGNDACWTGGAGIGDLNFSGVGTRTGNWAARGRFYTGDRAGYVCFLASSKKLCTPTFSAGVWAQPASGGVTGVQVTRF